jgi:hypothetical protein
MRGILPFVFLLASIVPVTNAQLCFEIRGRAVQYSTEETRSLKYGTSELTTSFSPLIKYLRI